jgi:cell division protein ZapE
LAHIYSTVIISEIPELDQMRENQARRFIALIDEFYDRRVKIVISANVAIEKLYSGKLLTFEFERTVSRLIEMQSSEYLALSHLA